VLCHRSVHQSVNEPPSTAPAEALFNVSGSWVATAADPVLTCYDVWLLWHSIIPRSFPAALVAAVARGRGCHQPLATFLGAAAHLWKWPLLQCAATQQQQSAAALSGQARHRQDQDDVKLVMVSTFPLTPRHAKWIIWLAADVNMLYMLVKVASDPWSILLLSSVTVVVWTSWCKDCVSTACLDEPERTLTIWVWRHLHQWLCASVNLVLWSGTANPNFHNSLLPTVAGASTYRPAIVLFSSCKLNSWRGPVGPALPDLWSPNCFCGSSWSVECLFEQKITPSCYKTLYTTFIPAAVTKAALCTCHSLPSKAVTKFTVWMLVITMHFCVVPIPGDRYWHEKLFDTWVMLCYIFAGGLDHSQYKYGTIIVADVSESAAGRDRADGIGARVGHEY